MKKKTILIGSLATISCVIIIGASAKMLHTPDIDLASSSSNFIEEKINENDNVQEIAEDKKIYIDTELMLAFEPTIENLYKNSDIIVVGTYNSSGETYTDGSNIRTETKFNVDKVIKNTTNIDVDSEVMFSRTGGTLTLDKYLESNPMMKKGAFEDIKETERKDYYVIQDYGPDDKLDFSKANNNSDTYILFLSYKEEKITPCCSYNGIRQIQTDKVYNYDTKKFESVEEEKINEALKEIK